MLKGYGEYKNISEFWLSSIPDNWDCIKIKHIFKERVEKGYPNKPLLAATQNIGVVPKNLYGNRTVEATKDLHLLKLVKTGDFVISLRSFQGGIEYAYYEGIISPAYTIMIPDNNNAHFFRYLFKSIRFVELLQNCVTGIREGQNIDYSKLRNHLIPIPPRPEQDQIVRYLDWKVSMINKYINAKKKQIELLKEQRHAIINQAVTKGLDPKAPMKNSGIEWLGKIPAHWEVRRLNTLLTIKSGNALTNIQLTDKGNYPVFGGGKQIGFYSKYNVNTDNIIIGRVGANCGNVTIILCNSWATDNALVVNPKVEKKYLFYLLCNADLNKLNHANAQPLITGTQVLATRVIYTSEIKEQKEIVAILDEKCKAVDESISNINNEIDLFHEYRTRLISDVVTGRVDVQGEKVLEFAVDNGDLSGIGQEIEEREDDE